MTLACRVLIRTSILRRMLCFQDTGSGCTIQWSEAGRDHMFVIARCLSRHGVLPPGLVALQRKAFPERDDVLVITDKQPAADEGDIDLRQLAAQRSNHGGVGWYSQLYCQGIRHYCCSVIKIGGMLPDLVAPQQIDGVEWSSLSVVMGHATLDSDAAGSNVLKQLDWLRQPDSSCAEWHEQAEDIQQGASLQYSNSRKADTAAQQLLSGSTASQFNCQDVRRGTLDAAHDKRLAWGPAAWTMNRARQTKKKLKKAEYDVGTGKSAADLIVEHQEGLQVLADAIKHPKPETARKCFIPLHGSLASGAMVLVCATQSIDAAVLAAKHAKDGEVWLYVDCTGKLCAVVNGQRVTWFLGFVPDHDP